MQQVEKRLDLIGIQQADMSVQIDEDERTQLLAMTTQLELPELNLDTRLEIVAQMREVLACPKVDQTASLFPVPILMEENFS
jgi:hypothetical protein